MIYSFRKYGTFYLCLTKYTLSINIKYFNKNKIYYRDLMNSEHFYKLYINE